MSVTVDGKEWNPRYVAYARSHGHGPEQMLAADRKAHPGACMMEFIFWVQRAWREWEPDEGKLRYAQVRPERVAEFDAWLAEKVEREGA